jgi:hypothetical protein
MPAARLSRLRMYCRAAPLLLLPFLAACGPDRNEFAPACPKAELVPALSDAIAFAGPGPGHDLTDLVYQAGIANVRGKCQKGDGKNQLAVTVAVVVSVQRGPAMKGRDFDIPLFLAVTDDDQVRDKKVFPVHMTFPPNVDRLTVTSPDIEMTMPVSAEKSGLAYKIIAGFQLSPEQLAANRQARGR